MGHIIRLRNDRHQEALRLLPWYVTGRLDPAEHAEVAAHVSVCAECQAELRVEHRLDAEIAALPIDVAPDWAAMKQRIEHERQRRVSGALRTWLGSGLDRARASWRAWSPWLGLAVAAQILVIMLVAAPTTRNNRYHALGAARAPAAGNVVVMFRPDTTERALRQTLLAAGARLVDGPTSTDAYVLHVPAAERAKAVRTLRARADVALAEPIDAAP